MYTENGGPGARLVGGNLLDLGSWVGFWVTLEVVSKFSKLWPFNLLGHEEIVFNKFTIISVSQCKRILWYDPMYKENKGWHVSPFKNLEWIFLEHITKWK